MYGKDLKTMAKLTKQPLTVTLNAVLELNEQELRALDALAGYGDDAFLEMFYKQLGKHYMRPHEEGLRSLFTTIRKEIPPIIKLAEESRKIINEHYTIQRKNNE
jgi:hypothetical protein